MYVLTLVFLFILKIRFPRGTSIAKCILRRYDYQTLRSYRKLEKCYLKLKKTECHIEFLKTCLHYQVSPKFVQFKVTSQGFHNTAPYRRCQVDILKHEISNQERKLKQILKDCDTYEKDLQRKISKIDHSCLKLRIKLNNERIIKSVISTHDRKLFRLGVDRSKSVESSKVVFNLSSRNLSTREKDLLSLGLDFCIPFPRINKIYYFTEFESICHSLDKVNQACDNLYNNAIDRIRNKISGITTASYKEAITQDNSCPIFCKEDVNILKKLGEDKSIIITKADKGRATVVLDKRDYVDKLEQILLDKSKFLF